MAANDGREIGVFLYSHHANVKCDERDSVATPTVGTWQRDRESECDFRIESKRRCLIEGVEDLVAVSYYYGVPKTTGTACTTRTTGDPPSDLHTSGNVALQQQPLWGCFNPFAGGGWFCQYKMMQKTWKITETLANGYSSESTPQELSNEYQHDSVWMVIKNLFDCSLDKSSLSI